MAFFELDDVFTYQDANDIKKLWASGTAPADPGTGEVWLDTSATPNQLKRYNGSSWDTIGELTAGDLLNLIKTVDGSGSGLDADKLDGQEGSYYRNADNLNAGTVPLARIPTTLTGKDADKLDGQEGSYYQDASNLNAGTVPQARLSASDLLTLIKTVDGSGSGLDSDKLDSQDGSYYQNASNLNAGTVPLAQIPSTLTGKSADQVDGLEASQFIRSDTASNVSAHTEWQDTYQARFGNGADLRIQHNGSNSYIDNYTADMYIRQLNHGGNIYLQAENESGTNKTLLTLDPDAEQVSSIGKISSRILHNYSLSNNQDYDTGITSGTTGILIVKNETDSCAGHFLIGYDADIVQQTGGKNDTGYFYPASMIYRICIYFIDGTVRIANKTGSTKSISAGFFSLD